MDHQSRRGVSAKKRQRDRLLRLSATHPDWRVGCADAVGWSRLASPPRPAWAEPDQPWRLVKQAVATDDADRHALACSGLLLPATNAVWLRVRDGRPVRAGTTSVRAWCGQEAARRGTTALLLIGDNAAWHGRAAVRAGIVAHNRQVKAHGSGGRLLVCPLPITRPWRNPLAPKGVHTKRQVGEPTRRLPARALAARVCAALDCPSHDHIPMPEQAA